MEISCEWGPQGVKKLSKTCDVTIIVDVLSFSTSVDIAIGRSIQVFPYSGSLERAPDFARSHDAALALPRGRGQYSLSPSDLSTGPYVERLVLPSPNGSTLTLLASKASLVLCGCLRNASAVAQACEGYSSVGLVPAGERWPDGSLRPALEDWLGAGAIIADLGGMPSPEARAAKASFDALKEKLLESLRECPSGLELIAKGYDQDVTIAAQYNASRNVPRFIPPAYRE